MRKLISSIDLVGQSFKYYVLTGVALMVLEVGLSGFAAYRAIRAELDFTSTSFMLFAVQGLVMLAIGIALLCALRIAMTHIDRARLASEISLNVVKSEGGRVTYEALQLLHFANLHSRYGVEPFEKKYKRQIYEAVGLLIANARESNNEKAIFPAVRLVIETGVGWDHLFSKTEAPHWLIDPALRDFTLELTASENGNQLITRRHIHPAFDEELVAPSRPPRTVTA